MKLPNGYGTVYKLSGNRRNPYVARKTIGWKQDEKTNKKKQVFATIGYFPDRPTALQALADYNDNPYDLVMSNTTFSEIYERWKKDEFDENTNKSTLRNYKAAYNRCTAIQQMKMSDIRPYHLQQVLDSYTDMSYESVSRIRVLFNQMYKWCIAHDCIKKNYAENLKIKVKYDPTPRNAFTTDEIKLLWDNVSQNEYIKLVLILIYSGVRINELLNLKKVDVNFAEQVFYVRQSKTTSGVRTVPIADKVLPFWKTFIRKSNSQYVFAGISGNQLTYENFKKRYYKPLMEQLGLNHTIHETRHTCISQLTMQNANPTMIKFIVGHKSMMNLTEKVYTHIENSELIKTINLIP